MDKKLLSKIYEMYHRELYLYIYSLCGSRELAEDLLQETFLKALLSLSSQHANVRAWLYMVARNLYFNYRKKKKKEVDLEQVKDVSISCEDVAKQIITKENRQVLFRAMQTLSREKREVLTLQFFCGLTQKEIAVLLHISPENVRVLSLRGKREIKKYMEANGYDV